MWDIYTDICVCRVVVLGSLTKEVGFVDADVVAAIK